MIGDDHKQWVSQVFDRAAPEYGKKSSSFFGYFGRRLVEQAELKPHHRVLDVAIGKPINGRCRMHGGLSTGAKTQEGKDKSREAARRGMLAYWAKRR